MNFVARATGGGNGAAIADSPQPGRPPTPYAMPWGKHKGLTLDQVPSSYLQWCLREASALTDELRAEIERQLDLSPGSTRTAPEEEIRVLRRELSKLGAEKTNAEDRLAETRRTLDRASLDLAETRRELAETRRALARANLDLADMKARPRPTLSGAPRLDALRGVVKRWYRALAIRFHPDRGGSTEQAVVVTEAYSSLMREIDAWEKASAAP